VTEISCNILIKWFGISPGKYYDWKKRYGCKNYHNGWIPRDWWLLDSENESIIDYYKKHPFDGYRRLTYMMLDEDIVAVSPATVYRVLSNADLLGKNKVKPSKKGTGFKQPSAPHKHWHIDICYINIDGTFYYMCTIIDGYSRYIVHWEIREAMKEVDVEIILQRAREKFPDVSPRIISDNGPQFISKDFKEYIRFSGMTHVRTSPYYPQSNGKVERVQKTLKNETIRKRAPETLGEAISVMGKYIEHYNNERLHSSIGYITPVDKLYGKEPFILDARKRKLSEARGRRKQVHTLINIA
jgi:transposase InsO family protein